MYNIAVFSVLFIIAWKFLFHKRFKNHNATKAIYLSHNFIIIDKQADFKINSNNISEQTVQTFLRKEYPNTANKKLYHEYYFPHRLDYATSGILCIPRTKEVCKYVSEAFSTQKTKKYYIALVYGLLSKDLIDVNIPIGQDVRREEIQKMCTSMEPSFCRNFRTARTIIASLEEGLYNNYPATKIVCRPVTGRRHQIRVHCSFLGHTIIGDYTYSNRKDTGPSRMFLHSARLVIPNQIEDIDISTTDPFTSSKSWRTIKTIYNLNLIYRKLDNFYNKSVKGELW